MASSYPTTEGLIGLANRMDQLDSDGSVSRFVSPVSGEEIMSVAERKPGPWVGLVKKAIEEAVIEGTLGANDHAAAVEWLRANPDLWREDK